MSFAQISKEYPSLVLNERQLCDYELLHSGGFSPLKSFMKKDDYFSCLNNMRLSTGELFPIPIVLHVDEKFIRNHLVNIDDSESLDVLLDTSTLTLKTKCVTLTDTTGLPLAILEIAPDQITQCIFKSDLLTESRNVYHATYFDLNEQEHPDINHPYVNILSQYHNDGLTYCLSGNLIYHQDVPRFDFLEYRLSPKQTIENLTNQCGNLEDWNVIGFQTRNPMHRSHFELTQYAIREAEKNGKKTILLLNPVVGVTQDCDVNYHTRVKCYKELLKYYTDSVLLCLLPLSMRMAGPREALWHALIRKNYGCTHFIVGRDHAGPSYDRKNGGKFYGPYDAQTLLLKYKEEIGVEVLTSEMIVFACQKDKVLELANEDLNLIEDVDFMCQLSEKDGEFKSTASVDKNSEIVFNISGTMQRKMLKEHKPIPSWFTFPKIVDILRQEYANRPGIVFYLVGLSGAGKTFTGKHLVSKLRELTHKNISYLDADEIRLNISKGLGFSREDRSTNIRRIGYLVSKIIYHGGICVCANIAPFAEDRKHNRKLIEGLGGKYVEIYVKTALDVCASRDVKGLYKLAEEGKIKLTGVNDIFEEPDNSEFVIDGTDDIQNILTRITDYIEKESLLEN